MGITKNVATAVESLEELVLLVKGWTVDASGRNFPATSPKDRK